MGREGEGGEGLNTRLKQVREKKYMVKTPHVHPDISCDIWKSETVHPGNPTASAVSLLIVTSV